MARLAVPVNLPAPVEPLRNLAHRFDAINTSGSGSPIRCTICKTWGRAHPKLIRKGERFICNLCQAAS